MRAITRGKRVTYALSAKELDNKRGKLTKQQYCFKLAMKHKHEKDVHVVEVRIVGQIGEADDGVLQFGQDVTTYDVGPPKRDKLVIKLPDASEVDKIVREIAERGDEIGRKEDDHDEAKRKDE